MTKGPESASIQQPDQTQVPPSELSNIKKEFHEVADILGLPHEPFGSHMERVTNHTAQEVNSELVSRNEPKMRPEVQKVFEETFEQTEPAIRKMSTE